VKVLPPSLSGSPSRFKELAALINDISRDFLALSLAVPFKPRASPEKGRTSEIMIGTVPTTPLMHLMIGIISFHAYLIAKIPMRM